MISTSVILCTYNRSQSLAKALNSLAVQSFPAALAWEVLVVDNNSTDETRQVVQDFCRRYPGRFRYCFEPIHGLSHARNTGIGEARGEIVAFTDDDVIVESNWLLNLTASLRGREWAGAGGKIVAANSFSPPRWLPLDGPQNLRGMLTLFDLGENAEELGQAPFGANMAFRREMFEIYGNFRTDLGRRPGSMMCNEDTEFGRRVMAAGERLRYEPSAVVYHPVPASRLTKEYFLTFSFNYGRASVREMKKRPDIWGIPRRYLTLLKIGTILLLKRTFRWVETFDSQQRFYYKGFVWMTAGQIMELYRQLFVTKSGKNLATEEARTECGDRTQIGSNT
jgi:glycosyltransferase involved in cell wall biosynthesis